jgi:cyclohexyl-isocyanide hydratase
MSTDSPRFDRRTFSRIAAVTLAAGLGGFAGVRAAFATSDDAFAPLRKKVLNIGALIFPRMDQIDFTGPFSVLSRVPDATVHVIARDGQPVKDHKGFVLTPALSFAEAPPLDVLLVPGGPGQESLMEDDTVLSLIRGHVAAGKPLFSVCTGALICGAAGVLRGRKATTHWSAFELLRYFGAIPQDARVVVDGNIISAAGVTAGIDGALTIASLLRGQPVAEQIQLDIQYAPEPPFNSGTPKTAPREVLEAVSGRYKPLTDARTVTAKKIAARFGVAGL